MMACAGTDDLTRMGGKGIRVARAGLSLIELLIAVAIGQGESRGFIELVEYSLGAFQFIVVG